jgi:serine/threonine protein kinase
VPELKLENSIIDDRYFVERCLGRGSYAEIFLAYDEKRGGEAVIIKALNTSLQGTPDPELDQTLVENFQNEAIALDKVRHPNIIRRLGHGTASDLKGVPFHFLVLEYMPGGDMLSLCRKQPLELKIVLEYFQQVAEALAYAHSQKVIHRDIKPNNLLLSADHRTVKVADFGVAKMTAEDEAEITRVGTEIYAPPEHHPQNYGESMRERLTPSADVYSLAKTIFTAMCGRAPRQYSRQPILHLPPELAAEPWGNDLGSILKKATETKVADRYASIQEFWADFARLAESAAGEDAEATQVRSRLKASSDVARVASLPNFHALTTPLEDGPPKRAKIVVDLPVARRAATAHVGEAATPALASPDTGEGRERLVVAPADTVPLKETRKEIRLPDMRARAQAEWPVFHTLRGIISSQWLRWVFIAFLVFALVGLASSTYFYFADRQGSLPSLWRGNYREGTLQITDVNLRSEPMGSVLTVLPRWTRLRVYEERNGWSRVEVSDWAGAPPQNAIERGWVKTDLIKFE